MTNFVMPTRPGFRVSKFGLETNTRKFESPYNRFVQRQALDGARWRASYTLPRMSRDAASEWFAFLLKLKGGLNTFSAYDPDCRVVRGLASGSPLVKGGSQSGDSLLTDGWDAGKKIFQPGDYFSVNGEMKMLTQAITSDGSGNATLYFQPTLRNSPADNTPIVFQDVTCTMILDSDTQSMWTANHNGIFDEITFTGHEVFE